MSKEMGLPYETLVNCFVRNLITNETITFKAPPESISESYSASFDATEVRGRSAPYYGYSGNEARTVSYSVTLLEDVLGTDYMSTINKLRALVYPKYYGSLVVPPSCKIKLGDMVKAHSTNVFIVNSVGVEWSGTILEGSNHYSQAEISFDLTEVVRGSLPIATTSWW
jgi:hypothetical protein